MVINEQINDVVADSTFMGTDIFGCTKVVSCRVIDVTDNYSDDIKDRLRDDGQFF